MGLGIYKNDETQYLPIFKEIFEEEQNGGIVVIADIPTATLMLDRGVVVGVSSGLWHVIKTAKVYADVTSGAVIKVLTNNLFKVGDFISNENHSSEITAINTTASDDYHSITIDTGFVVDDGDILHQSTSEGLDDGDVALKYTPSAMTKNQIQLTKYSPGTGATRQININSSLVVNASVNESLMPYPVTDEIKSELTDRIRFF